MRTIFATFVTAISVATAIAFLQPAPRASSLPQKVILDPRSASHPLTARGETPAAFGRRCIPAPPHRAEKRAVGAPAADCVAPPLNIPDISGRRALSAGRLVALAVGLHKVLARAWSE